MRLVAGASAGSGASIGMDMEWRWTWRSKMWSGACGPDPLAAEDDCRLAGCSYCTGAGSCGART